VRVSRSRRIGPIPITTAMAIAMAGITDSLVVSAVGCGATLDATKIGRSAAIETPQSGSAAETPEMRRSTCNIARRCAHEVAGRKAGDRCVWTTKGDRRRPALEAGHWERNLEEDQRRLVADLEDRTARARHLA
jgi:hypothetical protein